jgi:uncharacterized protein YkwD
MRRGMTWFARFLDWFKPTPRFTSQSRPIEPFSPTDLAAMHNAERARNALPPLLVDSRRNRDAHMRANYSAEVNLTAPHLHDGFAPHPGDVKSGENAAMGQADSASVMADWMGSPGHRANILDPKFSRIGCGRATSASRVTYWYCVFGG